MSKMSDNVSKKSNLNKIAKVFRLLLMVFVIGLFAAGCDDSNTNNSSQHGGGQTVKREPGKSIEEYSEEIERKFNNDLKSRDNPLRKRIENAHITVTVKSAYVSNIKITTKNGKKRILKESDIRRIEIEFTTIWDGIIHRNGKTIFSLVVEDTGEGLQPIEAEITYTDAWFNIEDPMFWFKAGLLVFSI